jgi:hypothetical protein
VVFHVSLPEHSWHAAEHILLLVLLLLLLLLPGNATVVTRLTPARFPAVLL